MAIKSVDEDTPTNKGLGSFGLSVATAVLLAVLLVVFYLVTINNSLTISSHVEAIKNSPYPISVAAGRVETRLVQLQTLAERLTYIREPAVIDNVERQYAAINADLRARVEFIANSHYLDTEAAQSLKQGYAELAEKKDAFLTLCRDEASTDAQVKAYVENEINPLVDDLLATDVGILEKSAASVEGLYETASTLGFQTVAFASVLLTVVLMALALYLTLLWRKEQQQRRLQSSLEAAVACAQRANISKSQFLSSMSHDIRTPMNAIVGLTSIASAHLYEPERVSECLDRIVTSSKHLLCLINDVLDMGKIESGKIILNEERFSFPDVINGIMTIVQPQARAKGLALDIVVGSIGQEIVVGDSMRLSQALLNIIGNAVKYTPEGGSVRLAITEETSELEGYRNYRFVVQDTGLGMEPEFLERVFDPFEREGSSVAAGIEGTGLGMAITKNVIDMVGGTIQVESEVGVGSVFTVVVPLKPANGVSEEVDLVDLVGARILVVDDDDDVLTSTVALLEEVGLRGLAVSSGAEAVQAVVEAHNTDDDFFAIIVDWVMPEMGGVETIRRIRDKIGEETPIILLSAYDWTEVETEARKAGVTTFLTKPLFKSRLCYVLKSLNGCEEVVESQETAELPPVCGRVLLVEDNELNREIATELIRQIGPEVDQACDGKEAVEKILDAPVDKYGLVFMDVEMPRMGGIEATQVLCETARRTGQSLPPIIAMTANAFIEDKEKALAAGMDDFMTKPIDLKELERILRMYLS